MAKVSTRVVVELSAWMATKVAIWLAGALAIVGVVVAWMAAMLAATVAEVSAVCLQCLKRLIAAHSGYFLRL